MKLTKISITNFKAIKHVEFIPGNINVFIGSNGAGKSTFLEAIGLLSLAMTDRVDEQGLFRKGIRLSAPMLYQSSFRAEKKNPVIRLGVEWSDEKHYRYDVSLNTPKDNSYWRYHSEVLYCNGEKVWGRSGRSKENYDDRIGMLLLQPAQQLESLRSTLDALQGYAIYQPNTPTLRGIVSDPNQSQPLGLNGGRLAEALADMITSDEGDTFFGDMEFDELLEYIDWASGFDVAAPKKSTINANVSAARRVVEFQDRYMKESDRFTAYDASEGSLYVLFLMCLAMHKNAPAVFAVDNFDQAMNPRLARAVTREFCSRILAQEKTVFMTTHNPLVLDGLELSNPRIKLFTVERNDETGYVEIQNINISQNLIDKKMPLSRLWINGYIGGVPNLL